MQLGIHASYYSKTMFNKHLNKILFTLATIYIFSMGIWPLLISKGSLDYILGVWYRWQGINVGVLALLTSLMAFKVTKYREEEQRKRNFKASKAFLPHELDRLIDYFEKCAKALVPAHKIASTKSGLIKTPQCPEKPNSYKEVFADCIRFSDPEVAEPLSYIIGELQVHNSRLVSLLKSPEEIISVGTANIISYMRCLAELYLLVCDLFPMARNESAYSQKAYSWSDYKGAYTALEITYNNIDDLERHTKAVLESRSK